MARKRGVLKTYKFTKRGWDAFIEKRRNPITKKIFYRVLSSSKEYLYDYPTLIKAKKRVKKYLA